MTDLYRVVVLDGVVLGDTLALTGWRITPQDALDEFSQRYSAGLPATTWAVLRARANDEREAWSALDGRLQIQRRAWGRRPRPRGDMPHMLTAAALTMLLGLLGGEALTLVCKLMEPVR